MKKYVLLILILIIAFLSCTVSDTTGLIVLSNISDSDISNVKIGNILITAYISRGGKVDYWYSAPLTGKLTASGVVNNRYLYNLNNGEGNLSSEEDSLEFRLNYEYKIDIVKRDGKNYFFIHGGTQSGEDFEEDERDNPID